MKSKFEKCKQFFSDFACDTNGATAIEYALIVGVLSIALIAGYSWVAESQSELWNGLSNDFKDA